MKIQRHGTVRSAGISLAAALLLAATFAASASAGGRGATTVRGTQLAAGTCDNGGYAMTGSFVGCWWIDTFETKSDPDKAHYRATGREHFEGCLGTVCGTLTTTYSFTAKTDGPWPTSAELHGRCHHPVTGGTDGFAGATGEISFHDVVNVSPPHYPYWGNVRLAGSASAAQTLAATVHLRAATTTGTTGTTC
jgi:hypothetical protein